MADLLNSVWLIVLLVVGFGFVVFWHELGHFLAAKWVGIKVEQFALGFGPAVLSWRKGMGLQWGSSGKKLEELKKAEHTGVQPVDISKYGDTEYRWNWIPLGGYVKMLGQDDMRPSAKSDDDRAYNRKSIGQRMIVVSAGVIMNVILAAIGFVILFRVGFDSPPAKVGGVIPDSPADRAGQRIGDDIQYINGDKQYDFTRTAMSVALSDPREPLKEQVLRDGKLVELTVPLEGERLYQGMLTIGIEQPKQLSVWDGGRRLDLERLANPELSTGEFKSVRAGDVITHINGEAVDVKNFVKLYQAMQDGGGKPVSLTFKHKDGTVEQDVSVPVSFERPFRSELNFGGLVPRARIRSIEATSSARKSLLPGDVVVRLQATDPIDQPSVRELTENLQKAGRTEQVLSVTVERNGKVIAPVTGLKANLDLGRDENKRRVKGLGIGLEPETAKPVIADVLKDSAADRAHVRRGATIVSVGGKPVSSWFDVWRELKAAAPGAPVAVVVEQDGKQTSSELTLAKEDIDLLNRYRLSNPTLFNDALSILRSYYRPRQTSNILEALKLGVIETRDIILQFYLTIRRMTQGSVSPSQMMGPLGMAQAGWTVANRGPDWLLWFLSLISANLAVVNFLPIPIVDGGLFLFLIIEKIQGKPLSPRVQNVAQVVGLALLLGVFLFVTYNDILRMF